MYTEVIQRHQKDDGFRKLSEMEDAFEEKNVKPFLKILREDNSLVVRVHAVCALAEIGNEEATEVLNDILLNDPSSLLRHEAAFSLGQMGLKSALPGLMEAALNDTSEIVRHESAAALGSIGDEMARRTLEKAVQDSSEEVRGSALASLFNLDYLKSGGGNLVHRRMPRP